MGSLSNMRLLEQVPLIKINAVPLQQFDELLFERHPLVMLGLRLDVVPDYLHL